MIWCNIGISSNIVNNEGRGNMGGISHRQYGTDRFVHIHQGESTSVLVLLIIMVRNC